MITERPVWKYMRHVQVLTARHNAKVDELEQKARHLEQLCESYREKISELQARIAQLQGHPYR